MGGDPAAIRLRAVAAILARGITRSRLSTGIAASADPLAKNLADSLPGRLEFGSPAGLSVSHDAPSDSGNIDTTVSDTGIAP